MQIRVLENNKTLATNQKKNTMRKIVFILAVSLGLLTACEEDLLVFDTETGFVQLSSATGEIEEAAASPIVTSVLLGSGENASGVTVNFTVTAADPSRFTVEPSNGVLEIPAGQFSGDITITPVDNVIVDGNMDITISLESSSSVPIGVGAEGMELTSRTITLVDDDCPVDIDAFVGTFSVSEVFTAGTNEGVTLAGAFGESYQIEMVAQPGDVTGTKLVITNSAGFNQYIPDGTVMTLQACPGTVSFGGPSLNIAAFADLTIEEATFNETQGSVKVSGPLGNFGPYEFVLTRM